MLCLKFMNLLFINILLKGDKAMAANIENMFSVREILWHLLGIILADYPSFDDSIVYTGLNFNVEKVKAVHLLNDRTIRVLDDYFEIRSKSDLQTHTLICNNTLNAALSGAKRSWSYKHTTNVMSRVDESIQTLKNGNAFMETLGEEIGAMKLAKILRKMQERFLIKSGCKKSFRKLQRSKF